VNPKGIQYPVTSARVTAARVYWIIRFADDDDRADDNSEVYFTTAAVWPNSSLRSSSVRIAGWP
jgi:hypothetical protein